MKQFASITAAAVATLAFASPALASQSSGHLRDYSYNASTKVGKLTIFNARLGKSVYRVTPKTMCGVSFGQSGDEINCRTLGAAKFEGKRVRVQWTRAASGARVASLASVDMS